jgi:glutamyl-tRNA reductase
LRRSRWRLRGRIFERVRSPTGAGHRCRDTSEKVARALLSLRAGWIANRSPERAVVLAEALGTAAGAPTGRRWRGRVDITISSTSASGYVLMRATSACCRGRRAMPLLLIDLAVPRDIDPAVARMSDVFLTTWTTCRRLRRNAGGGGRRSGAVRRDRAEHARAVRERLAEGLPPRQPATRAAV